MAAKCDKILAARQMLIATEEGIGSHELAQALGIEQRAAQRYINELGAEQVGSVGIVRLYRLEPSAQDIEFADTVNDAIRRSIKRTNPK